MSDAKEFEVYSTAPQDAAKISPALGQLTSHLANSGAGAGGTLNRRDRGLIAAAALIARQQTAAMRACFTAAIDSGLKPAELSETIFHLAYYSGWPNAMAAAAPAAQIFRERNIDATQLPPAQVTLLPLDEKAEKQRRDQVEKNFGAVSPTLVRNTTDLLFRDLWLRPALAPRDRSLITVAALVATGQVQQITYHLGRAMDNGLTRQEAGEMLAHLAFYTGWPNCFSALPVFKEVFEKRKP